MLGKNNFGNLKRYCAKQCKGDYIGLVKSFPQTKQREYSCPHEGKVAKINGTGRQQLISVGRTREALQYLYAWKEPLPCITEQPQVKASDIRGALFETGETGRMPYKNTLVITAPYDGQIVVGYRFDDKGKIYYNYDMIAFCDNGRIVKWIGGDTIAYYEGDVRGAAASAIIFLFAPKNEDSYSTGSSPEVSSDSSDAPSGAYYYSGVGVGCMGGGTRRHGHGTIPVVLFSADSLILWYFVLTSSDAALGHDISLAISATILAALLVSVIAFRKKDFNDIYGFTFVASSVMCIIISVFFDNNGYSFFAALLISLLCVPIVIGGLSYIPSLVTYLLIKQVDSFSSNGKKSSTKGE